MEINEEKLRKGNTDIKIDLKEIDSPIFLNDEFKNILWFRKDSKDENLKETINIFKNAEKNKSYYKFKPVILKYKKASIIIFLLEFLLIPIGTLFLIAGFNFDVRSFLVDLIYAVLSISYEVVYVEGFEELFIFSLFISGLVFVLLCILVLSILISPYRRDYIYKCLIMRVDLLSDYINEKKKEFSLKSIDLDWDLARLIQIDLRFPLIDLIMCLSVISYSLVLVSMPIGFKPSTLLIIWVLIYIFFCVVGLLLGLNFIRYFILDLWEYIRLKRYLENILMNKQIILDSKTSLPPPAETSSVDDKLEFIIALSLQNKVARAIEKLSSLPSIPDQNISIYAALISVISLTYAFTAFLMNGLI